MLLLYIQNHTQKQKQHISYEHMKNLNKLNFTIHIYRQGGKRKKTKNEYIKMKFMHKIHLEKLSQVTDASTILKNQDTSTLNKYQKSV